MSVSGLRDKQECAAHTACGFPWHLALLMASAKENSGDFGT